MLSEHEFVTEVRDKLYPRIRQLESDINDLYNRHYTCGPTGVYGHTEVQWSIDLLEAAKCMLMRLDRDIRAQPLQTPPQRPV